MRIDHHKSLSLVLCFVVSACGHWSEAPVEESAEQPAVSSPNESLVPQPRVIPEDHPNQSQGKERNPDQAQRSADNPSDNKPIETPVSLNGYPKEVTGIIVNDAVDKQDFIDWLSDPKNQKDLAAWGDLDLATGKLQLKADATLSFTSFAAAKSFIIDTNGHHLTLVGHDFSHLRISTKQPRGHSGSVQIFSTAKTLPMIDASGSRGINGPDAICPNGETCTAVNNTTVKSPVAEPQIEWTSKQYEHRWDWSDPAFPEDLKTKIHGNIVEETSDSQWKTCGDNHILLGVNDLKFRGTVKLSQTLLHPTLAPTSIPPKPRDAELILGTAGGTGFNGGQITVVQFGAMEKNWRDRIVNEAGQGGLGGLNLKAPTNEEKQEKRLSTIKTSEQLLLDELSAEWTIRCITTDRPFLLKQNRIAARFKQSRIVVQSNLLPENLSLLIPAVPAGRDYLAVQETHALSGNSGLAGRTEVILAESIGQWEASIHPKIPRPKYHLH